MAPALTKDNIVSLTLALSVTRLILRIPLAVSSSIRGGGKTRGAEPTNDGAAPALTPRITMLIVPVFP